MNFNDMILKIENNNGNFFEYDKYIEDGCFIQQIKKTYYIHFISLSNEMVRRRACYFNTPLIEEDFLTAEEIKKKRYKEKTGYENPSQNPEIKNKKEETTLKNYGFSYILKNK